MSTKAPSNMSSKGFLCDVCNLDYSTWGQFEEHFWSMIHHKQLETKFGSGKTHVCSLCNTRSDSLSDYAKHLISMTHRDAIEERKKQKQLQSNPTATSQSHSSKKPLLSSVPQGVERHSYPTASVRGPFRQPGSNAQLPRMIWQQIRQFRLVEDDRGSRSKVFNSFQVSSTQEWSTGNSNSNRVLFRNRTWTPKSDFEDSQSSRHPHAVLTNPSNGTPSGHQVAAKTVSTVRSALSKSSSAKNAQTNKQVDVVKSHSASNLPSSRSITSAKDAVSSTSKLSHAAGSSGSQNPKRAQIDKLANGVKSHSATSRSSFRPITGSAKNKVLSVSKLNHGAGNPGSHTSKNTLADTSADGTKSHGATSRPSFRPTTTSAKEKILSSPKLNQATSRSGSKTSQNAQTNRSADEAKSHVVVNKSPFRRTVSVKNAIPSTSKPNLAVGSSGNQTSKNPDTDNSADGAKHRGATSKSSFRFLTSAKDRVSSTSKPNQEAGSSGSQTPAKSQLICKQDTVAKTMIPPDKQEGISKGLLHKKELLPKQAFNLTKSSTSQDKNEPPQMIPTAKVVRKLKTISTEVELKVRKSSDADTSLPSGLKLNQTPQTDKLVKSLKEIQQTARDAVETVAVPNRGSQRIASKDELARNGDASVKVFHPLKDTLVTPVVKSPSTSVMQASSLSAITHHIKSAKLSPKLERSASLPSGLALQKGPPEVTRIQLSRGNSEPGNKELTSTPSSNAASTSSVEPALLGPDGLDEEASVTRVQLPPSLQRELTKLLVKSQGPRPRPNLAAARSRLHAGEHHQAQVVESPDRMVQQLLMKLLDSPKSRERQVQQIEELQRLVQASKKGSERARFGVQQLPEVSLQALEYFLESGQLKPLLADNNTASIPTPNQEHPQASTAGQEHEDSKEAVRALINATTLNQVNPSTSTSTTPSHEPMDSKESVRAMIKASLDQEQQATASEPKPEQVDSKEALQSLIAATDKSVTLPTCGPTLTPQEKTVPEVVRAVPDEVHRTVPRAEDKASPKTKDQSDGTKPVSVPTMNVVVKTEPDSNALTSSETATQGDMLFLLSSVADLVDVKPLSSSSNDNQGDVSTTGILNTNRCLREQSSSSLSNTPVADLVNVKPLSSSSIDNHGDVSTTGLLNTNRCLHEQSSSSLSNTPMEVAAIPSNFRVETTSMTSSTNQQLINMLSASIGSHESVPTQSVATASTNKVPAQRKSSKRKPPPTDLQEILLELSLQEELLHKKLGTVESSMKTTKELIQKKQLQFKKLKDQKNKISLEMRGIRAKRLQLLTETTRRSSSTSVSSTPRSSTNKKARVSPKVSRARTSSTTSLAPSQGLGTALSSQGVAPSSITISDSMTSGGLVSMSTSVLESALVGLSKQYSNSPALASSSLCQSSPRTLPQIDCTTNHQPVVGSIQVQVMGMNNEVMKHHKKGTSGIKRKLQEDTSVITPINKKAKMTKTPKKNSSKTKANVGPVVTPATSVPHGSLHQKASPACGLPQPRNPSKGKSASTKIDKEMSSEAVPKTGEKHVSQGKPQQVPADTGVDTTPWATAGSSQPGRLNTSTTGTPSHSTMLENHDVFEVSSDSEGTAAKTNNNTKTGEMATSHPLNQPAKTPGKASKSQPQCKLFPPHSGAVLGMCLINQTLCTVAADYTARVYDIHDFSWKKVLTSHSSPVTCITKSTLVGCVYTYLCTGSRDRTVRIYDTKTLKLWRTFHCEDQVTCLAVKSKLLYAAMANGCVTVCNMKTMGKKTTFQCKKDCKIECMIVVKYDKSGKCLAIGYDDWTIGLHDMSNGRLLGSLHGHNGPVLCLTAIKQLLYSGSADKTLMVHNLQTRLRMKTFQNHGGSVTAVENLGPYMATACLDGKIRLFKRMTGRLLKILAQGPQMIQCMAHGKNMLYFGCSDGSVQAVSVQLPASNEGGVAPNLANTKKKKEKKKTQRCQWLKCGSSVSVTKMFKHVREFHMRQTNMCLWGKCRTTFDDKLKNRGQAMTEHARTHLKGIML